MYVRIRSMFCFQIWKDESVCLSVLTAPEMPSFSGSILRLLYFVYFDGCKNGLIQIMDSGILLYWLCFTTDFKCAALFVWRSRCRWDSNITIARRATRRWFLLSTWMRCKSELMWSWNVFELLQLTLQVWQWRLFRGQTRFSFFASC